MMYYLQNCLTLSFNSSGWMNKKLFYGVRRVPKNSETNISIRGPKELSTVQNGKLI